MAETYTEAPEIVASNWLNTERPLSLREMRGKVVMLHAFQMLCPGCLVQGTPQAAAECFADEPFRAIERYAAGRNDWAVAGRVEANLVFAPRLDELNGTKSMQRL